MKPKLSYSYVFFFLLSISLSACSQDTTSPSIITHEFSLGSAVVIVCETKHTKSSPFQLVQLHHNEATAGDIARQFSEEFGIDYLQILNQGNRLIDFREGSRNFRFDPNRIFSKEGIKASLDLHSRYSDRAHNLIKSFGESLLQLFDSAKTIVALHNNRDEEFTLADYTKNKTGLVYRNASLDPDDFFITTDSTIYERLKEKDFNVVWEWSDKLKDDGSLSIYCSRNNIRYVNVEAEHGHAREQAAMLKVLIEVLK